MEILTLLETNWLDFLLAAIICIAACIKPGSSNPAVRYAWIILILRSIAVLAAGRPILSGPVVALMIILAITSSVKIVRHAG